MKIGYTRYPTTDHSTQPCAFQVAGCDSVVAEEGGSGRWDRPALHQLLAQLRPGDTVVVCALDQLSQSFQDLLVLLERIDRAQAFVQSLAEGIDTSTPSGRTLMQMIDRFADYGRSMLKERTRVGLQAARSAGRIGGRPRALSGAKEREVVALLESGRTASDAARVVGVSPSTVSRLSSRERIRRAGVNTPARR